MEPIRIKATSDTPKVECNTDGTITLSGKSLTEDPYIFYKPIIEWVGGLTSETITFNIQLDYMNTSCSKEIYNLLKTARDNSAKKQIFINWFCDSSDEDSFEIGKEFESMLEIPFNIKQF
ncbi:MAG TPA: DUF1987 domain-containing protein [Bacteroidales bacterium]